jgi:peptidoglycan/xylan/chitin deacetylase (PgdA/CDA1 family)
MDLKVGKMKTSSFSYSYKSDSLWEDCRQTCIAKFPLALPFLPCRKMPHEVGILMYHRIACRRSNRTFPTSNVTPDRFREQLSGLLERGFVARPLKTLLDWHHKKETPDANSFAVTFDDGYANNLTNALPILQELNIPATVFVATAYIDSTSPFPFEDWKDAGSSHVSLEDWRALTSDECAKLLDSGLVELGAHTHTHQDFRENPDGFECDLLENIRWLQERFGIREVPFAFPFGKRNQGFSGPTLVDAARRTGVICGLTSENEMTNIDADPFSWGRWTASEYDSSSSLAAKLSGKYAALKGIWRKFKSLIRTPKPSHSR